MTHYIIRRVFEGILTMILVTLAVFILLRLGGGNPVEYMLPPEATQADVEKLTAAYGFDKNIWVQLGPTTRTSFRATWATPCNGTTSR